ncbi:hypothetical protein LTR22_025350 [Elasticomyces elasticus]|nr:hypothetical protein LTR22_025350 [Elasticomyces elasticus]
MVAYCRYLSLAALCIQQGSASNQIVSNSSTALTAVTSLRSSSSLPGSSSIGIGGHIAAAVGLSRTDSNTPESSISGASSTSPNLVDTAGNDDPSLSSRTPSPLDTQSSARLTSNLSDPPSDLRSTTLLTDAIFAGNSSITAAHLAGTACLLESASYASANRSWLAVPGHTTVRNTTYLTYVKYFQYLPQPTSTLCDGWPRARGTYEYLTINSTVTTRHTITSMITPYPTASPSCGVEGTACSDWWVSSQWCWFSRGIASLTDEAQSISCAPYWMSPPCTSPNDLTIANYRPQTCPPQRNPNCQIAAKVMQLYYWPVTREDYDVCNRTGTTLANTGVATAVVGHMTITSPYVAYSIPAMSAYDDCGAFGTVMTDIVISAHPSEVSSYNGLGGYLKGDAINYSFDFGDLAPNSLPADAWFRQQGVCTHYSNHTKISSGLKWPDLRCETIWEDQYSPILAVPTQPFALQSGWAGCTPAFGLYDPPKALQTAEVLASVTTPVALTSPAATPAQTTSVPEQTSIESSVLVTTQSVDSSVQTPQAASAVQTSTQATPGSIEMSSESPLAVSSQQPSITSTAAPASSQDQSASPVAASTSQATQNAGGIIASVLGSAADTAQELSTDPSSTPQSTTDPSSESSNAPQTAVGGAIASVLASAAESTSHAAQISSQQVSSGSTVVLDPPTQTVPDSTNTQPSASSNAGDPDTDTVSQQSPSSPEQSNAQTGADSSPPTADQQSSVSAGTQQAVTSRSPISNGPTPEPSGSTAAQEDPATPTSGQQLSTGPGGNDSSNSRTEAQPQAPTTVQLPSTSSDPGTTIGSIGASSITAVASGNGIVLGSSTLTIGGNPQTVNGQIVSAASESVVIGGSLSSLSAESHPISSAYDPSSAPSPAILTGMNDQPATTIRSGGAIIVQDGTSTTTVAAGAQATLYGQTISVPSSSSEVLVDGTSVNLTSETTTSESDGMGPSTSGARSATTASQQPPTSGAARGCGSRMLLVGFVLVMGIGLVLLL